MNNMTDQEIAKAVLLAAERFPSNTGVDNEGQFIMYTGVYLWEDGSCHDIPEEE